MFVIIVYAGHKLQNAGILSPCSLCTSATLPSKIGERVPALGVRMDVRRLFAMHKVLKCFEREGKEH